MSLRENIRKVLKEEAYTQVSSDKYSKLIKKAVLDYVDFDMCGLSISQLTEYKNEYIVLIITEKQLKINYSKELQSYLTEVIPLTIYVSIADGMDCKHYKDGSHSTKLIEESQKQSRLLSNIVQDGLFQVMKDTGLSLKQIKSKTDELPREVYERFIKDFINEEGYHQTDGRVQLGYEVEIQTHVYIDHFYMEGDKVTFEIKRFDNRGHQTEGYIESMLNLTDEEILRIVEDMINWGPLTDYEI